MIQVGGRSYLVALFRRTSIGKGERYHPDCLDFASLWAINGRLFNRPYTESRQLGWRRNAKIQKHNKIGTRSGILFVSNANLFPILPYQLRIQFYLIGSCIPISYGIQLKFISFLFFQFRRNVSIPLAFCNFTNL